MVTELTTTLVAELRPANASAGPKRAHTNALKEISGATALEASSAIEQSAKSVEEEAAKLEKSVRDLNEFVQTVRRNLQFSIDKDSGQTVIKVVDGDTDKVIRQIPAEETLALARRVKEQAGDRGVIFHEQV